MNNTELKIKANMPSYYHQQNNEIELLTQAWNNQLPVLLKGPTGCGKTRFVQHMAEKLGRKLYTVACH